MKEPYNVKEFEMEENVNQIDDTVCKIRKVKLFAAIVFLIVLFTGSICATYFGKQCEEDAESLTIQKCEILVCKKPSLIDGKLILFQFKKDL